jgi:hypothetical protein
MTVQFDEEALTMFQLELDKQDKIEIIPQYHDEEVLTREQQLQKYVWSLQNLYRHLSAIEAFQITSLNNDLVFDYFNPKMEIGIV